MDAMDETPDGPLVPEVPEVGGNGKTYRPRGYQLEMLEESLRQNIIVAVSLLHNPSSGNLLTWNDTDGHR